ncbi:helicase-related protein [Devosia sp.]|uniref:DEAD/DEAH box helicase n=1 Tax=Devosia sp. TaxID=1871048 RepID=UPI003BA844A7
MKFRDSAERTSLNLMAHALRTWNEATGALDRLDVDPLPHQITLVHRILSSGNTNWLVADDVGLGKTIEVGLLLGALERRQNLRRILVVVPSGLTRQWKDEMLTKFNRKFRIYGRDFEIEQSDEWGLYEKVIVSLDLAKPRNAEDDGIDFSTRFGTVLGAGKWDIVIFDEAHRLSRDIAGRTTLRYKLARALREQSDSVILLTGTPHQGDVGRFKNLLKLVRPELAESIDEIEDDPSVVADIVLRNRKIDVVDAEGKFIFRGLLVRRAEIPNSPETLELERRLGLYLRRGYRAGDSIGGRSGRAIGFVMTIYRKLASSSVWALFVAMTKRKQRLLGELPTGPSEVDLEAEAQYEIGEDNDNLAEVSAGEPTGLFFDEELHSLNAVLDQARASIAADRKILELEKIAADLVVSQNKKLLIFTEYRATQSYIKRRIEQEVGRTAVLIHGGMTVDEKQEAIDAFDSDTQILISTEAGGEGLNLQRNCHVLVNYDLPWNPARLQQRIGRLYRYGQQEKVVVINLTSKDTIDNEVLATVLERLEAVVRQMGQVSTEYDERHHSEVLGDLLDRLDINDLLEEARTGGVERTTQRVDDAIQRARESKRLQDDILANMSTLDGNSWQRLGAFTTKDLATFIKRSAALCGVDVGLLDDPERFDLRLPEALRGRFPEFANRSFIEARTNRSTAAGRTLLDFSSTFVRHLVDTVTRAEFGGGFGVIETDVADQLIGAMLVHFQNEQGEPRGVDLIAATRDQLGHIAVDNSGLRPLFERAQRTSATVSADPKGRKDRIDAIFDRIESEVAAVSEISRHAGGLFAIGIADVSSTPSVK